MTRLPEMKVQASLRDATDLGNGPGVETSGYDQASLRDELPRTFR